MNFLLFTENIFAWFVHTIYNTQYYPIIKERVIRIFKTKGFSRWARKERISDKVLKEAVHEISEGLFEADHGSGLLKKRLAKKGEGKRGGGRSVLAFKREDRAIFIFGFLKSEKSSLDRKEEKMYKEMSKHLLSVNFQVLDKMCRDGALEEVMK